MRTKECSECFLFDPEPDVVIDFMKRRVPIVHAFNQQAFKSDDRHSEEVVKEAIDSLKKAAVKKCPVLSLPNQIMMDEEKNQQSLSLLKSGKKNKRGGHFTWDKLTWREKINRKRELVKACLLKQAIPNLTAAARFAGVNHGTVKAIFNELKLTGQVASYDYNNMKSAEETDSLLKDISGIENGFKTVTDLKRRHPSFSRKAILKHLHLQGFRYWMLPKERKNPQVRMVNSTRVCRLISHIAQAISDPNTTILYVDEMKFPLYQTSTHSWRHKNSDPQDAIIYNRREAYETSLTAIALCSLEKFEAVQLFQREVTGPDFLYFLNTSIAKLPPGRHYTIIADNATWHTADVVKNSKISSFLYFNEPKLFQLNIIENAFSFIRHAFRKREIVQSLEEEARSIVRIFFDPKNVSRFKGLLRNHLRQLESFLLTHMPK